MSLPAGAGRPRGFRIGAAPPATLPFRFTAVPYCLWDNRDPGQMQVWLREV
jgi:hypothetical protein